MCRRQRTTDKGNVVHLLFSMLAKAMYVHSVVPRVLLGTPVNISTV